MLGGCRNGQVSIKLSSWSLGIREQTLISSISDADLFPRRMFGKYLCGQKCRKIKVRVKEMRGLCIDVRCEM